MMGVNGVLASRVPFVQSLFVGLVLLSVGYFLGQQQDYECKPLDAHNAQDLRPKTGETTELYGSTCKQLCTDSDLQRQLSSCKLQRVKDEKPKQDDPDLVEFARKSLLLSPNYSLPYKLSVESVMNSDRSQNGQTKVIREIFNGIIKPPADYNGFFIEVGAYDGEYLSNTLWFEREWKWTGLMIESNTRIYPKLVDTNRKAWCANVCLSTSQYAGFLTYYEIVGEHESVAFNGLVKMSQGGPKRESQMYCIPLYTLLLALNQTVVDVFSLDIEGAELAVLKTIPFDKVHIKVLTIETEWVEGGNGPSRIKAFMNENGYKLYKIAYDSIFVHSKYLPKDFKE